MTRKAVFFDRDGTLIADKGYLQNPEDIQFLDGVVEALAILQGLGYQLFVVSNQSGIGRGIITKENVEAIHARISQLLLGHGVYIQHFYYCPHAPWERCPCRKPNPELMLRGITQYEINPKISYMVGDKWSDVLAGIAAGVRPVYLSSHYPPRVNSSFIVVPNVFSFTKSLIEGG